MTHPIPIAGLAGSLLLAGCGARGEPSPGAPPPIETAYLAPPDTLVLVVPGGATVWLAEGRRATDSAGAVCLERSIEIRRDSSRVRVPLLYTLAPPTLLDDSTLKAELAHNCRRSAAYRVSLRTGAPVRIP